MTTTVTRRAGEAAPATSSRRLGPGPADSDDLPLRHRCVDVALLTTAGQALRGSHREILHFLRSTRLAAEINGDGPARMPADGPMPATLIHAYATTLHIGVVAVRDEGEAGEQVLSWFAEPSDVAGSLLSKRWAVLRAEGRDHCALMGVVESTSAGGAVRMVLTGPDTAATAMQPSGGVAAAWPQDARVGTVRVGGPTGHGDDGGPTVGTPPEV